MMDVFTLRAVTLAAILAHSVGSSAACEVARIPTLQELYANADEVFVGKILSVRQVSPYREAKRADGTATIAFPVIAAKIRVSQLFKGKSESTKLASEAMLGDCATPLPSGQDCLLFTTFEKGQQTVAFAGVICDSRSIFSSDAHKEFLRSVEQVKALSAKSANQ
jgi:hypothetical protein